MTFQSFFMGGFECSTHKRRDGIRLDVIAATRHDVDPAGDYRLLANHGLQTVRDGVRWHLVEQRRGQFDFASLLPMVRAARDTGTQVIWDLFHYGWPNWVDVWKPSFPEHFGRYARAVAQLVRDETDAVPWWCPVNEISFFAWIAGDVGGFFPFGEQRGGELKAQLVRAAIAATQACRDVDPRARFICAEPLIRVAPKSHDSRDVEAARAYTESQFEAVDMLTGRVRPELGGAPDTIDRYGVNFYVANQWTDGGSTIPVGHHSYRALADMLTEVHRRYGKRLIVAETGTEGGFRAAWLHYVADQVAVARADGTPVDGICLYPILSHPGWDDDRRCPNGLFDATHADADRAADPGLAAELARQAARFAALPPMPLSA